MRGLVASCLAIALASTALADPRAGFDAMAQAELRDVLITTGTNLRDHERHSVDVQDCQMTTFWWRLHEEDWVMWSSFQFQMAAAQLGDGSDVPVKFGMEGHADMDDLALFVFVMVPGAQARHEVPFVRTRPNGMPDASPRGDGTTHHFRTATNFYLRHENRHIADRARRFSAAYVEYVQRYCNVFG